TWSGPIRAPFGDREYITVDQTGGKYDGCIYLHLAGDPDAIYNPANKSSSKNQMLLFTSTDGESFKGPAKGPTVESLHRRIAMPGPGVVMDDGTFIGPYWTEQSSPGSAGSATPISRIEVVSSTDGGATLNEPRVVATLNSAENIPCGTAVDYG